MTDFNSPPRWATRLLKWYCRSEIFEDLAGDLEECYHENWELYGKKANLIYVIDVFKFIRFYTVKNPKMGSIIHSLRLLSNYSKTSVRNIFRNPLFSSINIFGLAICMSIGLLVIAFLFELSNFDGFHEDKENIYRVISTYQSPRNGTLELATSSVLLGQKMEEQTPGIKSLVILNRTLSGDVKKGNNAVPIRGLYASKSFFDVLSFPLIQGNPKTALQQPNTIVITTTLAKKLFDDEPLGQIVEFNDDKHFEVTGIVEDPPMNSHIKFEALVSLQTLENEAQNEENPRLYRWSSMWDSYVYLKKEVNTSEDQIYSSMQQIADIENKTLQTYTIEVGLQKLSEILPGKNLSNQIGPAFQTSQLYFIIGLTLIILISACFNYTNLSLARSIRRAKEIGVRKVLGAKKGQIFGQFIIEAITIALISLSFSLIFFYLIKPYFLSLDESMSELVKLNTNWNLLPYFLLFAILIGLLAGFMPSILMSRLQTLLVLKDTGKVKLFKQFNFRKTLIVLQFAICIVLIISTIGLYRQYQHAVLFDLGYQTEYVVNVDLQGNDPEILSDAFATLPAVKEVSNSQMIMSTGDVISTRAKYNDPLDSARVEFNAVDEHYLPLHNIELAAGKNFGARDYLKEIPSVIVNAPFLQRFNIGSPNEAIDEIILLDGQKMQIIGVLENLHHSTIFSPIHAFALVHDPTAAKYLNLKIDPTQSMTLMSNLNDVWKKIDPVHTLNAEYFDDRIKSTYEEYAVMMKMVGFLACIAILIAAMGLLGITIYHVETKLREIGIRKTFGASENQLVLHFSRGFLILLFISAILATPASYYFLDSFVISQLTYPASKQYIEFSLGLILIFSLGFLIIFWQIRLAAKRNPVEVLKNE